MTPDSSFYLRKIQKLSQALLLSGTLNIGVLAIFSYWLVRERPPTPYCELKPASYDQQEVSLADQRGFEEVIKGFKPLSFERLIPKLSSTVLVENGYTERDLALGYLVSFQHFDLTRALSDATQPKQKRVLRWKSKSGEEKALTVYPGLTDAHFESVIRFAKTEQWPMTTEGLFLLLQKQKAEQNIDPSAAEAFVLTPEFSTIELLFKRASVRKQNLLEMVLEGDWQAFKQFTDQQRQLNDLSAARYQKLLLDYIKQGSQAAARLLLEIEAEFAVKKLDDAQVIAILQLLPAKTLESEKFALALLTSPRSTSVWQQASLRLYEYAGEPIPKDWNYTTSLKRFAPDKVIAEAEEKPVEKKPAPPPPSKPQVAQSPAPLAVKPAPLANAKKSSSAADVKKAAATACRLYIVQEGDSLWKISRRFGVDMEVLKKRNQLQSTSIKPGTVLKIP